MFVSSLNNQQPFSMQVREAGSTNDNAWRRVYGKEAAAVNPLAAVNHGRNSLILDAIQTSDWSKYNNFQAKQHPAWYDNVNGEAKQNKLYYGNLIDVQNRSLKEAVQSGDEKEIAKRKANLDELISDFKKAPGEVPHVIAFITDPALAAEHGVGKPANDWYNSPYNNHLAASQGRFEEQNWYDNPYFIDNPKELTFALEAVQELRPEIAAVAAQINKGAYERNVASTSFTAKTAQPTATSVVDEAVKETENDLIRPDLLSAKSTDIPASEAVVKQAAQIIQQFSATTLIEQLFKEHEKTPEDFLLERLEKNAEQRKYHVV